MDLMKNEKIIIVGAGLCGTLLAVRLAQRGYDVTLYEKRPDMRDDLLDSGRSINLALSNRGLLALDMANLKESILKECIPMKGRMIHPLDQGSFISPYSGRTADYINSVSRSGLNIMLLNEAEKYNNITLVFDASVINVDLQEANISYQIDDEVKHDQGAVVIGTDGAGSAVRRGMMARTPELLFNYSQDFLSHGYKELSIDPTEDGQWKIEKEVLHIFPRGEFMMIALPNLDGSFTLTMFHPYGTDIGFNNLDTKEKVQSFFESYYPTLLPYVPHYQEEFFQNPVGNLGTIKCYPWQAFGKTLIMGDASHAIVPFYGQGMNASLEDVRIFDEVLEEYGTDWGKVFSIFQEKRKHNADAIADLAIDNFYEMRDHVDDDVFKKKRQIEMQLEQEFPDYYSKYSLVTFKPELPYKEAMKRGRKQDELLLDMCRQENFENIPLEDYYNKIRSLAL